MSSWVGVATGIDRIGLVSIDAVSGGFEVVSAGRRAAGDGPEVVYKGTPREAVGSAGPTIDAGKVIDGAVI